MFSSAIAMMLGLVAYRVFESLERASFILIEKEDFFQNGLFSYKYDLRSKINLKSAKFCVRSDLGNFS